MQAKKLNLIFIVIVVVIVGISGTIVVQRNSANAEKLEVVEQSSVALRQLELEIQSMFCAGCTLGVENYLSVMVGVETVIARLTPSRSATIFYDSSVITKEEILANEIFTVYTDPVVVFDMPYQKN